MNIREIKDNWDKINDEKYKSIIELIVNAVNDYPIFELKDTDDFLQEVNSLLKVSEVKLENLDSYLKNKIDLKDERGVWINESLSSLAEAFELMKLYKIEFKNVLDKIKSLKN